jgi:hypothetical protein
VNFDIPPVTCWQKKYDSEWSGLTELALTNSLNPSNSLSYGGLSKRLDVLYIHQHLRGDYRNFRVRFSLLRQVKLGIILTGYVSEKEYIYYFFVPGSLTLI